MAITSWTIVIRVHYITGGQYWSSGIVITYVCVSVSMSAR